MIYSRYFNNKLLLYLNSNIQSIGIRKIFIGIKLLYYPWFSVIKDLRNPNLTQVFCKSVPIFRVYIEPKLVRVKIFSPIWIYSEIKPSQVTGWFFSFLLRSKTNANSPPIPHKGNAAWGLKKKSFLADSEQRTLHKGNFMLCN